MGVNINPVALVRKLKYKGYPLTVEGVRRSRVSYAHLAEDLLAEFVLRKIDAVERYVDVGCFHPIHRSNTYLFYRKGWRGICIDANKGFTQAWKRYRPKDTFICSAVSDVEDVYRYEEVPGLPNQNRILKKADHTIPQGAEIQAYRLDTILDRYGMSNGGFDLLTVDCEGHDLNVLRSLDLRSARPRVIIVEDHERVHTTQIDTYLAQCGFSRVAHVFWSKIFVAMD